MITAPVVPPEREEDATVVAEAPLKNKAVVAIPRGCRKHHGEQLWESGGKWLVL